jgi:hypothetical protein
MPDQLYRRVGSFAREAAEPLADWFGSSFELVSIVMPSIPANRPSSGMSTTVSGANVVVP